MNYTIPDGITGIGSWIHHTGEEAASADGSETFNWLSVQLWADVNRHSPRALEPLQLNLLERLFPTKKSHDEDEVCWWKSTMCMSSWVEEGGGERGKKKQAFWYIEGKEIQPNTMQHLTCKNAASFWHTANTPSLAFSQRTNAPGAQRVEIKGSSLTFPLTKHYG